MKPFYRHLLAALALAATAQATGQPAGRAGDGYTHTTLASFDKGGPNGEPEPRAVRSTLLAHPDGHFYGTSFEGGKHNVGALFRMAADGTVTVLHSFSGSDGSHPSQSPLLLGRDGHLYGTTNLGGASGGGTAYRLRPGGQLKVLHSFGGSNDAPRAPSGGLVEAADGHFYGTTNRGGKGNLGTVFRLRRDGEVKVLHAFMDCAEGCLPTGLVDGGDGYLYGLTLSGGAGEEGTAYRIAEESGIELLHHFEGSDGAQPHAPLLRTSDGALFGVTSARGGHGHGTVFELARDGTVSVLAELTAHTGSPAPAALVETQGGVLFLATRGDTGGLGAVVRIDRNGAVDVVHRFRGRQGGFPVAGLVEAANGALIGATQISRGRKQGHFGTVYRIDLPGH
jgi:uncharacterized repeat protein (TIGR03803 family)